MKRAILPLAAITSILGLMAGVYASRPAQSNPPPPPPARATPAAPAADAAGPLPERPIAACSFPLRWRVARIDGEFGLSAADASATVERAAALWEQAAGRELFERDDAEGFPIAFVFDGRQAAANELAEQREILEQREGEILAEQAALTERRDRFNRDQAAYTSRRNAFNQWAASHNAVVRQWNRDGNIPDEILRELRANDDRLRLEEAKLGQEGQVLQRAGDSLNADVDAFEGEVEEHRRRVEMLDRIFATGSVLAGRFLQGATPDGRVIPTLREIQIFQFDDLDHLELVMAHELGHSLGLDHVEVATAVMAEEHELAGASLANGVHAADLAMLRETCPQP